MTDRIWAFLTSLRLTVALLALSILLVFIGTVAQADEGLYQAQERYFKQWIVWGFSLFGHKVPLPLPGGYLLGLLLLVNLLAGHIKRFEWTWRKLGIHLTHAGVILLLVGQLATDLFSRETQMRFAEGETLHYSESATSHELVFSTDADADSQQIVSIPSRLLARGGELRHESLPFTVRVKSWWPNSQPVFRAPMQPPAGPPLAPHGLGQHFDFRQEEPTKKMDERNIPTAVIEIVPPQGPPSTWVVSAWAGDPSLVSAVRTSYTRQAGPEMARQIVSRLTAPQSIEAGGKTWTFTLRPLRVYNPFSMTLLQTTHKVYPGTDIPKDFRSRVRIVNPQTGEDREVEIFMNSPLRYGGQTFYQYQMGREELDAHRGTSTLQVVRNPSWLTPYVGCLIVSLGLTLQFMTHLLGFVSRKRAA